MNSVDNSSIVIENYEKKIFDLKQLIEISKGLNSSLSYNTLIESILLACMGQLQLIEVAIFLKKTFLQKDFMLSRNYKGFELAHDDNYYISSNSKFVDYLAQENHCFTLKELKEKLKNDDKSINTMESINPSLIVPLVGKGKLNGIIILGERINGESFSATERDYIMDIASLAGIAIHNANLHEMSTTDMMTQLKIHQFFQITLIEEREKADKTNNPLTIAMIDIDHFKNFNDTYGHTFGDVVLKRVAAILRENTRYNDTVARYGGEEFSIILTNTEMKEALKLTERVRVLVEQEQLPYGEKKVGVTVSIGLAQFDPKLDISNDIFIDRADKALYQSKLNGRNRITY
jgi:diguanylate cyclase (GGDEF)-like protein